MKEIVTLLFSIALYGGSVFAQGLPTNSSQLIAKSIQYHDKDGILDRETVRLILNETRPNGSDRKTLVELNPHKQYFMLSRQTEGNEIMMQEKNGKYSFALNGRRDLSNDERNTHRLNQERLITMRDYYHYLWYMPMKLRDPGTVVNPEYDQTDYFGTSALQVKVTYDPEVGSDVWYFYFDPVSYALIGYRFYHDEEANDGEYILFEGETIRDGVRIPKKRSWYMHKDNKFLGADILEQLQFD